MRVRGGRGGVEALFPALRRVREVPARAREEAEAATEAEGAVTVTREYLQSELSKIFIERTNEYNATQRQEITWLEENDLPRKKV